MNTNTLKILFVTPNIDAFNPTQGASQRSNLLLNACAHIAQVDVVSFCTNNKPDTDAYKFVFQQSIPFHSAEGRWKKLMHLCTPWNVESTFPVCKEWENIIDKVVSEKEYDYIVIRYVPMASACGLLKHADKLVLDVDDDPIDVASISAKNAKTFRNRLYFKFMRQALKISMRIVKRKVKYLFYSNTNQVYGVNTLYLPNVPFYSVNHVDVDAKYIVPKRLMFVGDMYYQPNIKAVEHFLNYVYPEVKKYHPEVSFHIVGKISDDSLINDWTEKGANVMGFVDSLIKEYAEANCIVVPMYSGGGTCIKILEAMQMLRPIVTTPMGFRGYDKFFEKNIDIMVADTDKKFTEHIISILTDQQLYKQLTTNAQLHYQQHFSKERFYNIVKDTIYTSNV